jgi:predicted enzyme related to lactoylglutathione lyase
MSRVVHFEIHADDPERAIRFYHSLFGWEFRSWGGGGGIEYWLIVTGPDSQPGINGGLLRRQGPVPTAGGPVNGFICTVHVETLDDKVRAVRSHGGEIVVPRMPITGVGWLVYAKDTEGNIFGMHQADPDAR